jgi:hypothetical protein
MFSRFIKCDDGAITVDYVVLTAGVTGVGLAMMSVVAPPLGDLARVVVASLEDTVSSIESQSPDGGVSFNKSYDFTSGGSDWSGATITDVAGFGKVLGPIAGSQGLESVTTTFALGPGATSAELTFDLLAFDSLDNEDGVLFINGVEIGRMSSNAGKLTWKPGSVQGITLSADIVASGEQLGGMNSGPEAWWKDGIGKISVKVDNPGEFMTFGFGSTANQDVDDESWGLDNFIITAS